MLYDDEVLAEFRAEGLEHLDALERALLTFDSEPGHTPSVDVAFRAIHSLKGAAGFLQRPDIERMTHHGEELLDLARKDPSVLDSDAVSSLLRCGDACRQLLEGSDVCEEPWVDELVDELVEHHRRLGGSSTESILADGGEADPFADLGLPEALPLPPPGGTLLPEPLPLSSPEPLMPPAAALPPSTSDDESPGTVELVVQAKGAVRAPSASDLVARRRRRQQAADLSSKASSGASKRGTGEIGRAHV